MATIFWDCESILLIDFKECNATVNGRYYASLLHKLKYSIHGKRRGRLTEVVRLLHDHTSAHTAAISKVAVRVCGFQELRHPPHSPDLAACDICLLI